MKNQRELQPRPQKLLKRMKMTIMKLTEKNGKMRKMKRRKKKMMKQQKEKEKIISLEKVS